MSSPKITVKIKGMRPATDQGKTVAYFDLEILIEKNLLLSTRENKLIEGAYGLFVGAFSKNYMKGGKKIYKPLWKFERDLQELVNEAAIAEYRRVSGPQEEPEAEDIPW